MIRQSVLLTKKETFWECLGEKEKRLLELKVDWNDHKLLMINERPRGKKFPEKTSKGNREVLREGGTGVQSLGSVWGEKKGIKQKKGFATGKKFSLNSQEGRGFNSGASEPRTNGKLGRLRGTELRQLRLLTYQEGLKERSETSFQRSQRI